MAKKGTKLKNVFENLHGANGVAGVAGEKANFLDQLTHQLYNSEASADAMGAMLATTKGIKPEDYVALQRTFAENPFNVNAVSIGEGKGSAIGNTAKLLGANIMAHPFAAGGTALNAGLNVAGLFNDDKWLGQALGTVAGAVVPKALGMGFGPLGTLNAAMLGGNLGSLFDTLSAKAERDREERERMAKLPAKYTTY